MGDDVEMIVPDLPQSTKPVEKSFPEPTADDFDEDIPEEERNYYMEKYKDLEIVKKERLHCTACDKHLGAAAKNDSRIHQHPMLRALMCRTCLTFYNSGEFEKGEDGSELYCRWCGQGGQVYCCSGCPHVFCSKCIKRNLGGGAITAIEAADDWRCFKCVPRALWDLRATCWALLRYCSLMNKLVYATTDPELKEAYQKEFNLDDSECCANKRKPRQSIVKKKEEEEKEKPKDDPKKGKDIKREKKEVVKVTNTKSAAAALSKISPSIQVKKFASFSPENAIKIDSSKKATKRPATPNLKPVAFNPTVRPFNNSILIAQQPKRPKLQAPSYMAKVTPIRPVRPVTQYRPAFNGYQRFNNYQLHNTNYTMPSDNINLSLESLTGGLDMNAVAALAQQQLAGGSDDLVCTPDLPLEPLCEVTEDNNDDDVECITPAPAAASAGTTKLPPLAPIRPAPTQVPDLSPENIIQMTENDVTINAATGGLKFRVDPQTLSANKMYRLPDGRIFAINANANMPGGYSATIVAVSETATAPRGATYAAKLSTINKRVPPTPNTGRNVSNQNKPDRSAKNKGRSGISSPVSSESRQADMTVPVEWYRYNLLDAIDSLSYSLSRLQKLKKEASTQFLRTRTTDEMKILHRNLDRVLNTSMGRFREVKDNLYKGLKGYLSKKGSQISDDDDDDVEILNEPTSKVDLVEDSDGDDAILIEENPVEPQELDAKSKRAIRREKRSNKKVEDKTSDNEDCLNNEKETEEKSESDKDKREHEEKDKDEDHDMEKDGENNENKDDPESRKIDTTEPCEISDSVQNANDADDNNMKNGHDKNISISSSNETEDHHESLDTSDETITEISSTQDNINKEDNEKNETENKSTPQNDSESPDTPQNENESPDTPQNENESPDTPQNEEMDKSNIEDSKMEDGIDESSSKNEKLPEASIPSTQNGDDIPNGITEEDKITMDDLDMNEEQIDSLLNDDETSNKDDAGFEKIGAALGKLAEHAMADGD